MKRESLNSILFYFILSTFFFLMSVAVFAQTQTIRGKVTDGISNMPIIGANVILLNSDPLLGTSTNIDGNYVLENVPVGRQAISIRSIGYKNQDFPNILVTVGKEVILDVKLEESVQKLDEVVVTANGSKAAPNNELAKVSARTFSLEEVNRYSGGRNDVARLASSFAGVSAPNDSRNDIVVRGNSPTGLLWRVEGIPMQTTNHFSTFGTTGGPVSALNTNLLKTSDFLTGAFHAEYGNANAAVFDVEMRKGNNQETEYTAQLSAFSGAEFMAEGPINKEKGTSYLASYRYGIASLAATGTSATPYYQDFSFKADLGETPLGRLSVFGLGGISSIDFLGDEIDENDLFANPNQDAFVENSLGLLGGKLVTNLNSTSYLKTSFGYSMNTNNFNQDNIIRDQNQNEINKYRATEVKDRDNRYTINSVLNKKFNARTSMRAGVLVEFYDVSSSVIDRDNRVGIPDEDGDGIPDEFRTVRDVDEQFVLSQYFAQGEYKFTDDLSVTAGLHAQQLTFNNDFAIEPRAAVSWGFRPNQTLSAAYGLHSQVVPFPVLFYEELNAQGESEKVNNNLEFSRSHHYVLSYDRYIGDSWRVKVETYLQDLFNLAVDDTSSSYSVVNEGADFVFNERGNLKNGGTGMNYGVELTVEKFFSKGYYMLATASMFESTYKGSDGIERSTAFNNQFVVNFLAGKEWKVGKEKRNAITFDTRLAASQGNPFTPINLDATRANGGREVLFEDQAYSQNYDDYFRWDMKVGFQLNGKKKKVSHQFFVDFQNVLNRENEFTRRYNEVTDEINSVSQIGFFPDVLYRIQF